MKFCLNDSHCGKDGQCVSGICACTNQYFTGTHDGNQYNALVVPLMGVILQDMPSLYYIYIFVFILLASIGLISNIFSLITFCRGRIRYTVCGVYLIMFSICSIVLMIVFLMNIIMTIKYNNYLFRFWACHGQSYLFTVMINMSILMTVAIAIENFLVRYVSMDRFRSRKFSVVIIVYLIILGFITNLDKIFARNLIKDQSGQFYCTYDYRKTKFWYYIHNSTPFFYFLIPFVIHFTFILFIIFKILQQKQKYCRKLYNQMDILLPSIIICICLSTYGIVEYLLDSCIIHSNELFIRLHIEFLFILHLPQILTFVIYILSNKSYLQEFRKTEIYQLVRICFGFKQADNVDLEQINKFWQRRHSSENVMTISCLNDYLIQCEYYKNIKLAV